MTNADELYERYIKPLPLADQQRLLVLMNRELAAAGKSVQPEADADEPLHDLLELEGLGAEIWEGVDAQEYVNALRDEWKHRP